jgi:translocation and assembly module TamB
LANALGLDELSFSGGAGGTTGATVTLGKRVSRDFYMAYERSLAGTLGTLYIFYDLSRRLTLRAQTGEQSAVDLIFTIRYD